MPPISTGSVVSESCSDSCGVDGADSPELIFDPTTGFSSNFRVEGMPSILRAILLQPGIIVKVQMVYGCAQGDMFTDLFVLSGVPVTLSLTKTLAVIPFTGRYRCSIPPGSQVGPGNIIVVHTPQLTENVNFV